MREPSIHITKRALTKILMETIVPCVPLKEIPELTSSIMRTAKNYSIRHRSLLESNATIAKRAGKIKSASKVDAMLFAQILTLIRRSLKHQGIKNITERDGVQWQYIVETAGLATAFTQDIEAQNLKEGYTTYIRLALEILKPFSLSRFKSGDEKIRALYEAYDRIVKDPNEQVTNLLYEIYQTKVAEKTGITLNYRENPVEFGHFVGAAEICKELNIHAKYFMTAQFDQLDWTNGYPTPSQVSSFKAKERALKWMAENQIKIKTENKKRSRLQEEFFKRHANKNNPE